MVVEVAPGSVRGAELRPVLPNGVTFINDGSATVALVANQAGMNATGLTAGPGLQVVAGGGAISDIAGLRPTHALPDSAIVDSSGRPLSVGALLPSGSEPRFVLGDLVNSDQDGDREYVVIEFNAVIANDANNVAGTVHNASFEWRNASGLIGNAAAEKIVVEEPSIVDVDKRIVSVDGNAVTFEVVFSNSGSQTAHDVRIVDDFDGATNVAFSGAGSVVGLPQGGLNQSDANTLDVMLPSLGPGQSVTIRYQGVLDIDWKPVPTREVEVTYTSLSSAGELLKTNVVGGTVLTSTLGERTGNTADPGKEMNTYRDQDAVGLNKLIGTVWDDTNTPDNLIRTGGDALRGVEVTLTQAGHDGKLDTADDVVRKTKTDDQGVFRFSAVPDGLYRITVPTAIVGGNGGTLGDLRVRFDPQGELRDGKIERLVSGGDIHHGNDFGFVQLNDAPTLKLPGELCVCLGSRVPIHGVVIDDVDAGPHATMKVTLTASSGGLDVAAPAAGVTVQGNGTGVLHMEGTLAALNASLETLGFQKVSGDLGSVTVHVKVEDLGHTGDANNDGMPSDPAADNLCAEASLTIDVTDPRFAPVTEHIVQVIDQERNGHPVPVKPPMVRDPNDPLSALKVTISGISNPNAGHFLLPDGTRLSIGQDITVAQLQHLSFVPKPGFVGPVGTDGTMKGSTVSFSVADPDCGKAHGSIEIRLTPMTTPVVPVKPPMDPWPPTGGPPSVIGPLSPVVPHQPFVFESLARIDLDAGGLFQSTSVDGFFGEERIGPSADPTHTKGVANVPSEDCIPTPEPKPKPIKKTSLDGLGKPVPKFSEQIDAQHKSFKSPIKAKPRLVGTGKC